eukprot:356034-Chlamydomonas_euryale.AAC.10
MSTIWARGMKLCKRGWGRRCGRQRRPPAGGAPSVLAPRLGLGGPGTRPGTMTMLACSLAFELARFWLGKASVMLAASGREGASLQLGRGYLNRNLP